MDTGTEGTPDVEWRQGKLRKVLVCPDRIHRFGGTGAALITEVYLKNGRTCNDLVKKRH